MQSNYKTKQILISLFLLCFAFIFNASAQPSDIQRQIGQAQFEFDNGNYTKAVEIATAAVEKAKKVKENLLISKSLDIKASSNISLQKYNEAEISLNEAFQALSENETDALQRAQIYLRLAWVWRSQREFRKALDYSKKAVAEIPQNRHIQAKHFLNIGRILFSSGYDISAVIWLEKAEKIFESEKTSSAKLDTYRFLQLAWSSRSDYQKSLNYAEKRVVAAEKSRFKYQYRQALFELSTVLSATGQKNSATRAMETGLKISIAENSSYQAGFFLTSLLLNSLYEYDVERASIYLEQLKNINADESFSFEVLLGKAVVLAFKNEHEESENLFAQLAKMENASDFILPYWKIIIAERKGDWEIVIKLNQDVLELTEKRNFRDELPKIYLTFAKAYFHLKESQKSLENLEKSLAYVEEIRATENNNLSLGILEHYHDAYRLLTQIKTDNPQEAFELADFLKARLLKDKIDNSSLRTVSTISPAIRQKLEALSEKYIEDQSTAPEIEKNEKLVTAKIPELNLNKPDLSELDKISNLDNTAIISYFFTLDKELMAFVWEKEKPLKTVYLPVSESEAELSAKTTHQKIKNLIFFKKDGKTIYDKLLKPLNISAKHLIIIPDKSLWKIPFQALSLDGEKYLIEEKLISYTPSVSILLQQMKNPKPNRRNLQAFANPTYENQFLQYVNAEAQSVAEIYNAKPLLNATKADFERVSDKSDILHFSMHAQVSSEQPLESFLGSRKIGKEDGRLTVEELLNIKLKKGSLVFLASCDTNNVLSGEGLVSLAWAMMGSGATTVISAQWEANDKSTEIFTKAFYNYYKQGSSSAEALQKASLELVKNKSNNMHEPYYWADFTLNGDYR